MLNREKEREKEWEGIIWKKKFKFIICMKHGKERKTMKKDFFSTWHDDYVILLNDSVRIKRFYGKINHFSDNDTQVSSTDQINIFIHPLTSSIIVAQSSLKCFSK